MSHGILFKPVKIGPGTVPNGFLAASHATGCGASQPLGSSALGAVTAEGGCGTVAMRMIKISGE